MPFQPKRVLVLGTTGECGGRIAKGCADAGHNVTGVSRNTNEAPHVNLDGVERLQGDKGDPETFTSLLAGREFDVVVDAVPQTDHVKLVFEHLNGHIEHYFIISSTGTYAPLLCCPADESNPWREETGINFYWQSQRDSYALDLCREHGFPVTIFRPTNIIGRHRIPLELWGGRNIKYWELMREGKTVEIPETDQVLLQSGCNDDLATAFVLGAYLLQARRDPGHLLPGSQRDPRQQIGSGSIAHRRDRGTENRRCGCRGHAFSRRAHVLRCRQSGARTGVRATILNRARPRASAEMVFR